MTTTNELIHVTYADIVRLGEEGHYVEEHRPAQRLAVAKQLAPVLTAMHNLGVLDNKNTYRLVLGDEARPVREDSKVYPRHYGVVGRLRDLQRALRETVPADVLIRLPDVAILTGGYIAAYGVFLHDDEARVWGYNTHDYV